MHADLAAVAISSVSRVLSGHPDVSATMRDRVLAAVQQLEYEVLRRRFLRQGRADSDDLPV